MKQILMFLSAMLLCCCSSDSEVMAEEPANAGKTLVVYYSYTGNCREIVNTLTNQMQADVLEIQPAEKGLKYEANNYALGTQLLNAIKDNPNDASSYPSIEPVTTSLNDYQNIIIVTPLWWSQMAAIMQTYLFNYGPQMAGKHVGLIVSSASSGISGVVKDAKRLVPEAVWMGDALWINNSNRSNRKSLIENWLKTLNFAEGQTTMDKMYITIGGVTLPIVLVENAATQTLVAALQEGDITYEAHDYGGFEKVGSLGRSLPTSDTQTTTQAGDVILHNGNQIVLFYGSNSWSYTRLGRIEYSSQAELESFLKAGQGNITVKLSLSSDASSISNVRNASDDEGVFYSLNGLRVKNPSKGIYIKNGKKVAL